MRTEIQMHCKKAINFAVIAQPTRKNKEVRERFGCLDIDRLPKLGLAPQARFGSQVEKR